MDNDLQISEYINTFRHSSDRVRSVLYLMLLTAILTVLPNWTVRESGWSVYWAQKYQPERMAQAIERQRAQMGPVVPSKGTPLSAKDQHEQLISEVADELINRDLRQYGDTFIQRAMFPQVPILGIAIDVNDVALFGGVTLAFLSFLLFFSVRRQYENLYLCLFKVRMLCKEKDSHLGDSKANFLYHALVMAQLFLQPPTLARWSTGWVRMTRRAAVVIVAFLPAALYLIVAILDHQGYERARKALPPGYPPDRLPICLLLLAAVVLFTSLTILYSFAAEMRFQACFVLVNPDHTGRQHRSLSSWLKLREMFGLLSKPEHSMIKGLHTPKPVGLKLEPVESKDNRVFVTLAAPRNHVSRWKKRRMAKELARLARRKAVDRCRTSEHRLVTLLEPEVDENVLASGQWRVAVNWPYQSMPTLESEPARTSAMMRRVNLLHLFDHSLIGRRDAIAIEWQGQKYTFGEIEARSNRVANALLARGFRKGNRLCVYLANRIELIDLYLACVKTGVIFVPVNILYREREIAHITSDAQPRAVITAESLFTSDDERRPEVRLDGGDPAAIIYTSGTTGASKGAVLTHDNFMANAVNLTACWQITDRDRFLLALPLFHIHALGNGLHTWLLSGCRMRLLERFDHRTAIDEFLDFAPTLFFGVPTVYVRLLETPADVAKTIGAKMRLFVSGSAPLPAHVLERFRELFGHTILERYGMTETFMNLSNPYIGERRAGTVGFPLPGVAVRIENGELFVRGPNVFRGYWRRTDSPFTPDGFFPTGDLATVSPDGYYTLLGRRSDLIISGGFNIYPREIEELLLEHVSEAAVVGVPDDVRGEVPVAYIVGDFDDAELERVCREQLASFKVPRRFVRVDAIPRTALGKVQKHLLPR